MADSATAEQRVDASLTAPVSTTPTSGPAPHMQRSPVAAFDGTNYLVVWSDDRDRRALSGGTSSGTRAIHAARMTPAGVLLDPRSIALPTRQGENAIHPAVAFDGTNFLVVWCDEARGPHGEFSDGSRIRATRLSRAGVVLDAVPIAISTPQNLSGSTTPGTQIHPAVAWNGQEYLVVWSDRRNTTFDEGHFDIYGTRVGADGTVLDGREGVVVARHQGGPATLDRPAIAVAGDTFLVAWLEGKAIRGVHVGADGHAIDPSAFTITAEASRSTWPAIASDGSSFLVAWAGIQDQLMTTRWPATGTRDPGERAVVLPDTLSGAAYHPLALWTGSEYLVASAHRAWRVDATSAASGARFDIDGASSGRPAIASDGSRFLVATVNHSTDAYSGGGGDTEAQTEVVARVVEASGDAAPDTRTVLSRGEDWQFHPAAASDGSDYLVVWEDYRHGWDRPSVWGARLGADGALVDPAGFPIADEPNTRNLTPTVTFDGSQWVVAWVRSPVEGGRHEEEIFLAPVSRRGVVAAPVALGGGPATERHRGPPQLSTGGGKTLLTWAEPRPAPLRRMLVGTFLTPTLERASADVTISDDPSRWISNVGRGHATAWDGSNFVVTWVSAPTGAPYGSDDLYGARVSAAGQLLDPTPFVVTSAPDNQGDPAIASDGHGTLIAWSSWSVGLRVMAAHLPEASTVVEPPFVVDATRHSKRPSVAYDGTNWLVGYERMQDSARVEGGGGAHVARVRVGPAGASSVRELTVEAKSAWAPTVAAGAKGHAVVASPILPEGRIGGARRMSLRVLDDVDNLPVPSAPKSTDRGSENAGGPSDAGAGVPPTTDGGTPSPPTDAGAAPSHDAPSMAGDATTSTRADCGAASSRGPGEIGFAALALAVGAVLRRRRRAQRLA
jgi:hypothetical protein